MDSIDITATRRHLGLSKVEFSKRLGVTTSTLWNWEQGKSKPANLAREKLESAMYHSKRGLADKDIPNKF